MNAIEGFGLSLQQKHLWHLLTIEQENSTYQTWCKVSLTGALDSARLRAALERVVQRHEILRTAFRTFPGVSLPLQVIEPESRFNFSTRDLSLVSSEEQQAQVQRIVQDPSFHLEQGANLHAQLLKLSDEQHILLLKAPALCLDATSLTSLVAELSQDYRGEYLEGERKDDVLQYADYSAWQQELFEAEETQAGQQHWLTPGILAQLDALLPFEHLSRNEQFAPRTLQIPLDADLLRQVEELATRYTLQVSLIFQTSWQILLWRLQGKSDIVVGIASTDRKYEELAGAAGLFDQFLPTLCTFGDQQSFIEALTQSLEQARQQRRWQEFFNWDIVREQAADRPAAHEPHVHAAFAWEEQTLPPDTPLSWHIQECHAIIDRYVLCLSGSAYNNTLRLTFSFDAHRIDKADIQRLAGHYLTLLASALARPDQAISSLNMLSLEERQQILGSWNTPAPTVTTPAYVHEIFETYAAHHPQALALVVGDRSLTYRELNAQANALAVRLLTDTISTEARVGLFLERSIEQIVAMLGILKAGGAYVPLDPAWPRERLNLLLQECPLSLVITTAALKASLPDVEALPHLYLERLSNTDTAGPDILPAPVSIHPEQLAYVLYTSGSTGIPKGVAITHTNLRAYVSAILKELALPENSRYATPASLGADLGNTAIYAALCSGGCLHLLLKEQANDPHLWATYLREHQISCIKMVPSHLSALLENEDPASVLPGDCLILGGETLPWELARQILDLRPDCRVLNHYGPTESTVGVLTWAVQAQEAKDYELRAPRTANVPLGLPLSHAQAYVLAENGELLPTWETGELYLGGSGVARGYDEKADLTAERFLPDPWSREAGGRLYRTGDRGRWLPDGTLEFLGRLDRQVKIRGFRVELGEVEAALHKQADIRECVVEYRETRGEPQLVAYFIPSDNARIPDRATLSATLQLQLPDYMIPTAFVALEEFPRTSSGKINRQALPAPQQQDQANIEYVPPRTPTERTLALIWEEVLGRSQISVHANFFSLGGDSILSIRIIARAAQAGLLLTPKQLFQDQTIAELAAHAQQTAILPQPSWVDKQPLSGKVELTPIQRWFFSRQLTTPWHYNQAVLLQMHTPLKAESLEVVAHALLEQHDALRLHFQRTSEGWHQSYGLMPDPAMQLVEQVDLSNLPQEAQAAALTTHAERVQGSLSLESGILLRLVLFDLGNSQAQRLLLVIHHLAVDGVSWNILLEDLKAAYAQVERGETVHLPAKTTSYQQWASQLQQYAYSPEIEQQIPFWNTRLKATGSRWDSQGETEEQAAHLQSMLGEEETRALLVEVPPIYHTHINEVLLTALSRTLANWSGKRVVRIDMEGHGREEIGEGINVARTVGWFTTLYPLVLEAGEHEEIGQALRHVKEQVRSIPQGGLGYGVLRYLRQDEETQELRAHAWGLIRLNYLGQMDQTFQQREWWQIAPEDAGPQQGANEKRPYRLEINALTTQGKLHLNWNYSESSFEKSTIETLNRHFLTELQAIIAHCRQPGVGGYTPSDFPDITLSQSELDDLFAELGSERESENEWL